MVLKGKNDRKDIETYNGVPAELFHFTPHPTLSLYTSSAENHCVSRSWWLFSPRRKLHQAPLCSFIRLLLSHPPAAEARAHANFSPPSHQHHHMAARLREQQRAEHLSWAPVHTRSNGGRPVTQSRGVFVVAGTFLVMFVNCVFFGGGGCAAGTMHEWLWNYSSNSKYSTLK